MMRVTPHLRSDALRIDPILAHPAAAVPDLVRRQQDTYVRDIRPFRILIRVVKEDQIARLRLTKRGYRRALRHLLAGIAQQLYSK